RRGVGIGNEDAAAAVVIVSEGNSSSSRPEAGTDAFFHPHPGAQEDVFPFQLSEGGKNADHGLAVGTAGIKPFIDRYEVHMVGDKDVFDEVECVFLASAQ